jgi:hypothetical protein
MHTYMFTKQIPELKPIAPAQRKIIYRQCVRKFYAQNPSRRRHQSLIIGIAVGVTGFLASELSRRVFRASNAIGKIWFHGMWTRELISCLWVGPIVGVVVGLVATVQMIRLNKSLRSVLRCTHAFAVSA